MTENIGHEVGLG